MKKRKKIAARVKNSCVWRVAGIKYSSTFDGPVAQLVRAHA